MSEQSDFNCDFNAPMFVDFDNLDQEGNPDVFFDTVIEDDPAAPILQDVKPKEDAPPKLPPRMTRSTGPLRPINRHGLNTPVDPLRPKTSAMSSLGTVNKSVKPQTISKEKAAQIAERLCPSNATVVNKPKFVSMAEENKKFFGTPDRFRKKARAPSANSALYGRKRSPSPAFKKTIFATMPQSPNLLTRGRTRTRCNHEEPEKPEPKKPEPKPQENKLAALRRRLGSLNNKPIIRHTSTSKAREEKVKNEGSAAKNSLKNPLKSGMMRQHHGIPVILQNKLQKNNIVKSNDDNKSKKPIVANAAQLKLYGMDKEIRAKLEQNRVKEYEKAKELATVKARLPSYSQKPFMPKPSDKDTVVPMDPNLHTTVRYEERKQFDEFVKHKEAEMQALKLQEMERRQREERLESLRQRQASVHRANPVKVFTKVEVQKSEKPLTDPKTPKFSVRRRNRSNNI